MPRPERLLVIAGERPDLASDGIHDASVRLLDALNDRADVQAELRCAAPRQLRSELSQIAGCPSPADAPDAILIQYNPFSFGRRGFAPWLPRELLRLRRSVARPRLGLMVHEPYMPLRGLRPTLMGVWQRAQLRSLKASIDVGFASIESWAKTLDESRPRRPVHHLPVGSNLPDMRSERQAARRRLGIAEAGIAIAAFGTNHPSRLLGHVARSANAVARSGREVTLLNLGAGAPPIEGLEPAIAVHSPGRLGDAELASCLAGADVFVAPFSDGVSTRRTTMMAALQHGLAVVGTSGASTDAVLANGSRAVKLVPTGAELEFAAAVTALASDATERRRLGAAARRLYETHFAWATIADRLLAAFAGEKTRQVR